MGSVLSSPYLVLNKTFFFKILFIHERERQRHRQREKQAPCSEPDVGLDPGSPGSHPGLQAALNRCATGAALKSFKNKMGLLFSTLQHFMYFIVVFVFIIFLY